MELSLPGAKVPSLELSLPWAKVLWNFRSRERKFQGTFDPGSESSSHVKLRNVRDVDPEPVVASQEPDSLSVVRPHQQRRWKAGTTGSIARHAPVAPASWTYTSWLLSCTKRRLSLWSSLVLLWRSTSTSQSRLFPTSCNIKITMFVIGF